MEPIAKQIIFKGRVQGVGFRYTTHRIAGCYDLTGTVKNCSNGTVEAVFQGTQANIQACLDEIQDAFSGYIREMKIVERSPNPQYSDFRIAY